MEEFIVWDKRKKCFGVEELWIDSNFDVYHEDELPNAIPYQGNSFKKSDFEFHEYIGIKDINDKKIYADCSIVEFDFMGFGENQSVCYKGFIKWNKERYRYDIEVISHGDRDGDNYIFDLGKCIDSINNIKVIDTIQDNRLGLMLPTKSTKQ